MKIAKLCLKRYGPFTDKALFLSTNGANLNMIYGHNEAGKSTTLRALIAWMFGMPTRTGDDHVHKYSTLLVGAQVLDQAGNSHEMYRRKGTRATLQDAQGHEVDEQILHRMLGGLTEQQFRMFFGFDHAKLVEGGEQLKLQGGEAGQSLFAAGSGALHLSKVLDSLQAQADGLFKRTARQPKVNAALLLYKERQEAVKQAVLPAPQWDTLQGELATVRLQYQSLNEEIRALSEQKERYLRVRQVAPLVAQRALLLEKLSHLEADAVLPEGVRQDYREAIEHRDASNNLIAVHQASIDDAGQALKALTVPQQLLAHGAAIEAACKQQALYESKTREIPELRAQVKNLEQEILGLLGKINPGWGLDHLDKASLAIAVAEQIRELIGQEQASKLQQQSVETQIGQVALAQGAEKRELAGLPAAADLSGLQAAYDVAIKKVALDNTLASEQAKCDALRRQVENSLARLTGFSGQMQDLETLQVPSLETIKRFETDLAGLDHELQKLNEQLNEAHHSEDSIQDQLKMLAMSGDVPTEAELLNAREQRNKAWRQVRQDIDKNLPATEVRPHAEIFEGLLFKSDTVGDRLRREAQRVAEKASLVAEQEKAVAAKARLAQEIAGRETQKEQLLAVWRQEWQPAGITPLSPAEMHDWHAQYSAALAQCAQLTNLQCGLAAISAELDRLGRTLKTQLGEASGVAPGTSLEHLCGCAKMMLDEGAMHNQRRKQLAESIDKAQHQLDGLQAALHKLQAQRQAWAQAWASAITALGMETHITPSAMQEVLSAFQAIEGKRELLAQARAQLEIAQEVSAAFEKTTLELIAGLGDGQPNVHLLAGLAALKTALDKARQDQAQAQLLEKRIADEQQKLQAAAAERQQCQQRQQSLMQQAGCTTEEAMEAALNGSDHKRQALTELGEVEKQICHAGNGFSLEALVAEVAAANLDALAFELDEVTKALDAKELEKNALNQELGRLQNEERHLASSQGAGEAAEKAEAALAEVREHAESYMLAKLSHILLKQAIEAYRKKSQVALLNRAGEIFKTLTREGFTGIDTVENESGEKVLVGVRATGKTVGVEGLSEGTRDQIFLALRLASMEQQLQEGDPLPLVIDDILVNFDDARASAALQVLAELSRKTQVLFFTHHERLLQLAQQCLPAEAFVVHRLDQLPELA